ncbi:MAG: ThuA domain-containing protein [Anaerolineae bacterium]|nr:ThuA domain-containing protein [Anaerolineae bacterium]
MINITVWHEYRHEKIHKEVSDVYPQGMHTAIAEGLRANDKGGEFSIRTATLDESEHGLTDDVLNSTDVLIWWGHLAHHEVSDAIVDKVVKRVWQGMGLVTLHSGHFSKPFKRLMGTGCDLKWRESEREIERLWLVAPAHPIAAGLPEMIQLDREEMYGEHFDIPAPDELVYVSWFEGGEVFRSGCCWQRGNGRIFYFRPGHETFPTYYNPQIRHVIANGVRWAAPVNTPQPKRGHHPVPLQKLSA